MLSNLKRIVRTNYSNPPTHGGQIIASVLGSPELRQQWDAELAGMRDRMPFLTVEDAGPGVPPEARAELGQRFRRFAGADTAGTGLGLSIVKRIAELHGATVVFEASAAGGLAVTVSFPT